MNPVARPARPRVCVVGVGAVGGWLAGVLDAAGWEVRLLARGATLQAVQAQGLRLTSGRDTRTVRALASDDPRALGPVDYVILAVKTQSLTALGPQLSPLIGPDTAVVTALNGLQWWFGDAFSALAAQPLQRIDPGGALRALYPANRVIGGVVHATIAAPAPGRVEVIGADKLIFGEADGCGSARLTQLVEGCRTGGVHTERSDAIRLDVWRKLWGNMCLNPLSALTRATTGRLLDDAFTRELAREMMREMSDLGERLGLSLGMSPDERMAVARRLGDFQTSMQRDAEAGRRLEVDALLGVLVEIAERLHCPAPTLGLVFGLTRQLDLSLARSAERTGDQTQ